jgi:hypothetical protein
VTVSRRAVHYRIRPEYSDPQDGRTTLRQRLAECKARLQHNGFWQQILALTQRFLRLRTTYPRQQIAIRCGVLARVVEKVEGVHGRTDRGTQLIPHQC